ncbi:cell wall-binding repeat-containing protein [Leifsonia sp. NPDC058292]|uniref:cell wall-binding repeat-containing protein n=1 Tax=Leifsonia sp. NPDC058292 TaxID=3346428 RepID=UPI0036DB6629
MGIRRATIGGALTCVVVLTGIIVTGAPAVAEPGTASASAASSVTSTATHAQPLVPSTPADPGEATMSVYLPQRFEAEAAALPQELVAAVRRDLGLDASDYLATSAASVDAAQVVAGLKADGVTVNDSRIDGTTLLVGVGSAEDAAVAESRGAEAVVGDVAPTAAEYAGLRLESRADLIGGTGWGYTAGASGFLCSIGFNGFNLTTSGSQFVTAGHCLRELKPVPNPLPVPFAATQAAAGSTPFRGDDLGAMVDSSFVFGGGNDSGLVSVTNGSFTPKPTVSTWGGRTGAPTAGTPVTVRGTTTATTGSAICKSGSTSGWTCGKVLATNVTVQVGNPTDGYVDVNSIVTNTCMLSGDSGGSAMIGAFAVGVSSGSDFSTCANGSTSVFFPMSAPGSAKSITQQQAGVWEIAVSVPTPSVTSVTSGSTVYASSAIAGTLPSAVAGDKVELFLDGATTPTATAAVTAANPAWSFPLANVGAGAHTYRVDAAYGTKNHSASVSGSLTVVASPTVNRVSGQDRYAGAIAVSQAAYPDPGTAKVVYLASGETFPDALSAAAAAAKEHGPLLLTPAASLPPAVKKEIERLAPEKIVVVGGPGAVSAKVFDQLDGLSDELVRYSGLSRYETSQTIVDRVFGDSGVNTLYIATGANFPDALSAGAAAGANSSAVLLVPGSSTTLDAATSALITKLHPAAIRITGGTGSVSPAIAAALAGKAASVTRVGGIDRYATSQAINSDAFASASSVYIANGLNFPDALAGAVLAAENTAPLYVTRTTCMVPGLLTGAAGLHASTITLLGGTGVLTPAVAAFTPC